MFFLLLSFNQCSLQIKTIKFKTFFNPKSNHIGYGDRDFFIFEISGTIRLKDSICFRTTKLLEHNTEPRESHFFSGHIAHDGINANPQTMVQNAINEFSYRTYVKLLEIKNNK